MVTRSENASVCVRRVWLRDRSANVMGLEEAVLALMRFHQHLTAAEILDRLIKGERFRTHLAEFYVVRTETPAAR